MQHAEDAEAVDKFFPSGKCRHYWMVDGWAKLWCVRMDKGHLEHRNEAGERWVHPIGGRAEMIREEAGGGA